MPEHDPIEVITTEPPAALLAATLAECAQATHETAAAVRAVTRTLEKEELPAIIQRCDYEDERNDCREPGTVHNCRAVMDVCPGHHEQLDRELDSGDREPSEDWNGFGGDEETLSAEEEYAAEAFTLAEPEPEEDDTTPVRIGSAAWRGRVDRAEIQRLAQLAANHEEWLNRYRCQ